MVLALIGAGPGRRGLARVCCSHDGHASVHLAHELTAWDMGLAVGFLLAAVLPARAWGMLPLAVVLVPSWRSRRRSTPSRATRCSGARLVHLLELAGLGVLWVLARRMPRPRSWRRPGPAVVDVASRGMRPGPTVARLGRGDDVRSQRTDGRRHAVAGWRRCVAGDAGPGRRPRRAAVDRAGAGRAARRRPRARWCCTSASRSTSADDTLEVLDASGRPPRRSASPSTPTATASAVAVALPDLDDGAYVVAWRVVSSDSHPISGAFTFRVGDAAGAGGASTTRR